LKVQTFWEHLEAFRYTLIQMGGIILIGIVASLFLSKPLLEVLLSPLAPPKNGLHHIVIQREWVQNSEGKSVEFILPSHAKAIFPLENGVTSPTPDIFILEPGATLAIETPRKPFILTTPLEGFLTQLKVSFFCGAILTSPLWLWICMRFLLPALHQKEIRLLLPFCVLSLLFISAGVLFAFKVTLPLVSVFFRQLGEGLGENIWALSHCLDFVLCLFAAHALAFECFAFLFLLVHKRILTHQRLKGGRRYVIVAIFIAAAIFTPPDVLSQLLLAFPLIVLYEGVIFYASYRKPMQNREQLNI